MTDDIGVGVSEKPHAEWYLNSAENQPAPRNELMHVVTYACAELPSLLRDGARNEPVELRSYLEVLLLSGNLNKLETGGKPESALVRRRVRRAKHLEKSRSLE